MDNFQFVQLSLHVRCENFGDVHPELFSSVQRSCATVQTKGPNCFVTIPTSNCGKYFNRTFRKFEVENGGEWWNFKNSKRNLIEFDQEFGKIWLQNGKKCEWKWGKTSTWKNYRYKKTNYEKTSIEFVDRFEEKIKLYTVEKNGKFF